MNDVGEPCAGEPHARFDAAAGGNNASRASTRRAAADASRRPYIGAVARREARERAGCSFPTDAGVSARTQLTPARDDAHRRWPPARTRLLPPAESGRSYWPDATLVSGEAVDVVARLKQESEVPLRSHGNLSMNRALMAAGLVDRV